MPEFKCELCLESRPEEDWTNNEEHCPGCGMKYGPDTYNTWAIKETLAYLNSPEAPWGEEENYARI